MSTAHTVPIPGGSSPLRGLLTIFFSPGDTFVSAGRSGKRPWLVPLIAACLIALAINVMVVHVIGMETIMRTQLESRPAIVEQMGQEKVDQMVRAAGESQTQLWIGRVMAVVGTIIFLCIAAGLILGGLMMTGAETNFAAVLTACAWAWYVYLAIQAIATAAFLAAVRDFSGVDVSSLIVLNPSMFLDRSSTSPALYSLVSSLDLLSFLAIFLMALGISKLSAGVSFGKAFAVVIVLWGVYVLGKAGFAAIF